MATDERGLYESLITEEIEARLAALDARRRAKREPLHPSEAADRFALHVSRVIERAISAPIRDLDGACPLPSAQGWCSQAPPGRGSPS